MVSCKLPFGIPSFSFLEDIFSPDFITNVANAGVSTLKSLKARKASRAEQAKALREEIGKTIRNMELTAAQKELALAQKYGASALNAVKAMQDDLAELEKDRFSMPAGDYEARRREIEQRYAPYLRAFGERAGLPAAPGASTLPPGVTVTRTN